ncbi:MAG: hypothetical protein ACYDDF_11910 [Thermoplasmatota archaeon]
MSFRRPLLAGLLLVLPFSPAGCLQGCAAAASPSAGFPPPANHSWQYHGCLAPTFHVDEYLRVTHAVSAHAIAVQLENTDTRNLTVNATDFFLVAAAVDFPYYGYNASNEANFSARDMALVNASTWFPTTTLTAGAVASGYVSFATTPDAHPTLYFEVNRGFSQRWTAAANITFGP